MNDTSINIIALWAAICSAIAAFGSWHSSQRQFENEIFRHKVNHINKLNMLWKSFNTNIEHISNYRTTINAKNKKPEAIINSMRKSIEDMLLNNTETKKLFGNKINEIEVLFIQSLEQVIPRGTDWTICHITQDYEKSINLYKELCNKFDAI